METSSAISSRSGFLNLFVKDFQSLGLVQLNWRIIGYWRKKEDGLWYILSDILASSKARGAAGLVNALFRSRWRYHRLIFRRNLLHKMMSV